ncbi:MAG TPA: RNA methyltransferase [Anaerolineae bacterium]
MITSADNPKVKQARLLLERRGRQQQGDCLVEGVRLIEDAMRAGVRPALIFFVPGARQAPRTAGLLDAAEAAGVAAWAVSPAVFATLSETVTSQGIVAIVPIPTHPAPAMPTLSLVLDGIRDPGNLGTILRSADAADVDQVLILRGCVDAWGPKVLRAGMGAHFRLAITAGLDWPAVEQRLAGQNVWVADAGGEHVYDQIDWRSPSALVMSSETAGISPAALAAGRGKVAIPMPGAAESLNVAMAATVLLFEIERQRRPAQTGARQAS